MDLFFDRILADDRIVLNNKNYRVVTVHVNKSFRVETCVMPLDSAGCIIYGSRNPRVGWYESRSEADALNYHNKWVAGELNLNSPRSERISYEGKQLS